MMYLIDEAAVDVSRITGIPWSYERVHQRGPRQPFIDLMALPWWDRFRVAWCLIGVYYFIQENQCTQQHN